MLLWFILTFLSVVYVAVDIYRTPESPVLKWAFVLLTAYTGPIGAFLYVLGCREPLPGLHERYVAIRWRQVLGSTMHCVAGDGAGILVGAILGSFLSFSGSIDITIEYILGFGFGWTIFQALFMKGSMGGSYKQALQKTFIPELISMNVLMAAFIPIMQFGFSHSSGSHDPSSPTFWFIMSMGLLFGFIIDYPINWWLVRNHLKHGMTYLLTTTNRLHCESEADFSPSPKRPRSNSSRVSAGPLLPNRSASCKAAEFIPLPSSKIISCGSSDGSSNNLICFA